jgi:hypothetical protein
MLLKKPTKERPMRKITTSNLIDQLVTSIAGSSREAYVLRQSIHAIVRLAKAEERLEVRRDAERAVGAEALSAGRRAAKAVLKRVSVASRQETLRFD